MLTGDPVRHRAAVIGSPIEHSLSPVLHRAAYAALGLTDWQYDRFAVGGPGEPDLTTFLLGLDPDWRGLSVTMPLKEGALAAATTASDHARDIGAANTLLRTGSESGSRWHAESTDAYGVLGSLRAVGLTRVRRAVVIGSGATSRSVVDALAELGCAEVHFVVRDRVRSATSTFAQRRGLQVGVVRPGGLLDSLADSDVVVSTVPTGTSLPLPELPPGHLVGVVALDVVYGDWPTAFARWARSGEALVLSGLEMLIHQAARQVELMTGRDAPLAAMAASVVGIIPPQ